MSKWYLMLHYVNSITQQYNNVTLSTTYHIIPKNNMTKIFENYLTNLIFS